MTNYLNVIDYNIDSRVYTLSGYIGENRYVVSVNYDDTTYRINGEVCDKMEEHINLLSMMKDRQDG